MYCPLCVEVAIARSLDGCSRKLSPREVAGLPYEIEHDTKMMISRQVRDAHNLEDN